MRGSSPAATFPNPSTLKAPDYALKSDLAQYCLPTAYSDENRKYAWVNSLCALFLIIGIIGIKPPAIIVRPPAEVVDEIPVVFTPPAEPVKVETVTPEEVPDEQTETPAEMPQVVTVVAANPAEVAFAVPVEGAVAFAPARFATPPPPPNAVTTPRPTAFNPSKHRGGNFPPPAYPRWMLQQSIEGRVRPYFYVDTTGAITNLVLKDSSGYPALDKHVLDWVRRTWQFPPGEGGFFYKDFIFKIEK